MPRGQNDMAGIVRVARVRLARIMRGAADRLESILPNDLPDPGRHALASDLAAALRRGDITLAFQPLACLETGRIAGFEALARWRHPVLGDIPPDMFIALAEQTGQIARLGRHVLWAAAFSAAQWNPPLRIAINMSPLQFGEGLATEVENVLTQTGLDPRRLELEITEGLLVDDAPIALAQLRRLKALGVRIAMDDFGTGYSSLSYFRQFPFDKVKIDRSFVREMETCPQALAVIQAVIGLGRGLGMPVVAEGVETEAQLAKLRIEGCDEVQGYLIGRPAPIEAFEAVIFAPREPLRRAISR